MACMVAMPLWVYAMRSKRFILIILLALGLAATASAQYPRAFGLRGGYTLEASYQHFLGDPHFLEVDLGLDLVGQRGFRLAGTYNLVLARPSWAGGDWTWYLGPGVVAGYVYHHKDAEHAGVAVAACAQLGVEYAPFKHLGISLDIRPMYGWHFKEKQAYMAGGIGYMLIPNLAIRFLF